MLRKKASGEYTFLPTAPIPASNISAYVELTSPFSNVAEVQENVTQANVIDMQRYLRWADKAMESQKAKQRSSKGHAPPKAA